MSARITQSGRALIAAGMIMAGLVPNAFARVDANGDVFPADPMAWTLDTRAFVGYTGEGSLWIDANDDVLCDRGYVGFSGSSTGSAGVDGNGSTWEIATRLVVGWTGEGELNVTDGGDILRSTGRDYIAYGPGSKGTVTVDGPGSTWIANGDMPLAIGFGGTGVLSITNGGAVKGDGDRTCYIGQDANSTGTVTVDGVGSRLYTANGSLSCGHQGEGTLSILSGGYTSTFGGFLGDAIGSVGTATVAGDGSRWDLHSWLVVGDAGSGALEVRSAGKVGCLAVSIAREAGSTGTVTVSGPASRIWSYGDLRLGDGGVGELHITDGGTYTLAGKFQALLGFNAGSEGVMTVDGNSSAFSMSASEVTVGVAGTGELHVTNGGTVTIWGTSDKHGNFRIARYAGSTGTVTVTGPGSALTHVSEMWVGVDGTGELIIADGGRVDTGDLRVGEAGRVRFDSGTLNVGGFLVDPRKLTGTGTINTGGFVIDGDLVFDSLSGATQTMVLDGEPGQDITVNVDVSQGDGYLGAGMSGSGTLVIRDGVVASSERAYIGRDTGSTGTVTVDGVGSMWTIQQDFQVGWFGSGELRIANGGVVRSYGIRILSSEGCCIGRKPGSSGKVTVDGAGSKWIDADTIHLARDGVSEMRITNGGAVRSRGGGVGSSSSATCMVDGRGSTWTIQEFLEIGLGATGQLTITSEGLVSVGHRLTIKGYADRAYINMATDGMLAVNGKVDGSITEYLDWVSGTDAIRYWDGADWAPITEGVRGVDYALEYIQDGGNLDGYTVLTVHAVPEPGTVGLLGLGALAGLWRRRGGAGRRSELVWLVGSA